MTEPVRAPGPFNDAPWDDDDPPAPAEEAGHSPFFRQLRQTSLMLLIVSTAVMFLAAIASNNAVPSSVQERIALGVHRISMFAMLLGFLGILLALRLPMLSAYLSDRREQRSATGIPPTTLSPELQGLLLASAVWLGLVWSAAFYGGAWLILITNWLLIITAALLVNMIILHTGTLRAFAAGMLLGLLLILLTWRNLNTIALLNGGGILTGPGRSAQTWVSKAFGIEITVSVVAGLISAFYCDFVIKRRARFADAPAVSQHE